MKCEKCNKEASFHYQSIINGEKSEIALCADCANEMGYGSLYNYAPQGLLGSNFFNTTPRTIFGDLFDSSFFSSPSLFPKSTLANHSLLNSLIPSSVMAPTVALPRVQILIDKDKCKGACSCNSTECAEEKPHNIPEGLSETIKPKMELVTLKQRLKTAVEKEDFEEAVKLRDKIRELEK